MSSRARSGNRSTDVSSGSSELRERGWCHLTSPLSSTLIRQTLTFLQAQLALTTDAQAIIGSHGDDQTHLARGEFDLETRTSEEILKILTAPPLLDALSGALGKPSFAFHYPPMVRFSRPGHSASRVPPHQDIAYNPHLQGAFHTLWIPFVPIDSECGGVRVYEESRSLGALAHTKRGAWEAGVSEDLSDLVHCEFPMSPGDLLLFDPFLLHESAPNTSRRIRFSLDCRFFASAETTTKSYLDPFAKRICRRH